MITRVQIEHYKSIEKVDLALGPLVVLVGPNGVGKSNFIDALRLIREAVSSGLDRAVAERHGIDSIRQWSPSKPYYVSLRVEVANLRGEGFLSFTLASYSGSHAVRREEAAWTPRGEPTRAPASYVRDSNGQVVLRRSGEPAAVMLQAEQTEELFLSQFEGRWLSGLASALSNFEAYSIYPNMLRTPQRSSSDLRLDSGGENLTSVFKQLTKSKRQNFIKARNEILVSMRKVMPLLDTIRIQSLGGLMVPAFRVKESNGKVHDFNVSQISDGTLRVLGLLTALYQPARPQVIAMEEPEQTINPGILAVLAEAIEQTAEESQVLVTTHSPEFLDKFRDPRVVIAAEMEEGVTKLGPVDEVQLQAVYERLFTLGELMSVEGLHR